MRRCSSGFLISYRPVQCRMSPTQSISRSRSCMPINLPLTNGDPRNEREQVDRAQAPIRNDCPARSSDRGAEASAVGRQLTEATYRKLLDLFESRQLAPGEESRSGALRFALRCRVLHCVLESAVCSARAGWNNFRMAR
jgi:hypothetical protein